jgi:hypothetical protein
MKKRYLLLGSILFANFIQAQTNEQFSLKLQGLYGNIINHDPKHVGPLIKGPVSGSEFSVEFQTMSNKPWQQYLSFPIVGIGTVWLNLGNPEKLGNAFALYPYVSFPLIRTNYFKLNLKAGAGVSYLTKTYYNTNTDSLGNLLPSLTGTNSAIGSNLNVYFSGGGNIEIPLSKSLSLTGDYTWNHISNGSAVAPNSGLNLLNGFIGLKYSPNYKRYNSPSKQNLPGIEQKITCELTVSGGFRQLYYKDNKTFPIGSIAFAAFHPIKNFMRMGVGIDVFYDGVYDGNTQFERTYLKTNDLKNKIRVGVSWQNELLLGRLTAGFHFGLYLYNPLKNLEPCDSNGNLINPAQSKGLIYSYNINNEDGWLYTRASLKYALSKHIFASVGLKTHQQKAEFIEWGLGYRF